MAKDNGKNAPAADPNVPHGHAAHAGIKPIEAAGWEDEQTGFPPYWEPSDGGQFKGIVVGQDMSDPEFIRYTVQATHPTACFRGSKNEDRQEAVVVQPGENFTVSDYVQLKLHQYFGHEILVTVKDKQAISGGHTMWNMRLQVSPETKKKLNAARVEALKALPQALGGHVDAKPGAGAQAASS